VASSPNSLVSLPEQRPPSVDRCLLAAEKTLNGYGEIYSPNIFGEKKKAQMSEMVTVSPRGGVSLSEREVSVHGCMVIVNGTTAGLEFGIDAFSWSLGNRFAGIYGVSKGLHLLVFGAGSHGAGREGVWVDLAGVVAKRWDSVQERLGDDGASIPTPEAALVHAQRVNMQISEIANSREVPQRQIRSCVWPYGADRRAFPSSPR
jgi:hypothetical protein